VDIEILYNPEVEWHESFVVVLEELAGVSAGENSSAVINILDTDVAGSLVLPTVPIVSILYCLLLTVYYTVYYSLCTILYTTHCVLYCLLFTVYCTVYYSLCTVLSTTHCILYCLPLTVYCTVYHSL